MQGCRNAPTLAVSVAGAEYACRGFGSKTAVPLILLTHLGANLDSWDPGIVDGIATERNVIAVGYRGVGDSTGQVRDSIEDMASGVVAVIRALAYDRVDVFGLSMGGMVAPYNRRGATARRRHLQGSEDVAVFCSHSVFPDSGHGVAFQNHHAFVDAVRDFLRR